MKPYSDVLNGTCVPNLPESSAERSPKEKKEERKERRSKEREENDKTERRQQERSNGSTKMMRIQILNENACH